MKIYKIRARNLDRVPHGPPPTLGSAALDAMVMGDLVEWITKGAQDAHRNWPKKFHAGYIASRVTYAPTHAQYWKRICGEVMAFTNVPKTDWTVAWIHIRHIRTASAKSARYFKKDVLTCILLFSLFTL